MSERAIAVGDLVMVVHSCCGDLLGVPFVAGQVRHDRNWYCSACNTRRYGITNVRSASPSNGQFYCLPISWLKRIDPPSESDTTETQQEKELTV